jgi:hypothetical protein
MSALGQTTDTPNAAANWILDIRACASDVTRHENQANIFLSFLLVIKNIIKNGSQCSLTSGISNKHGFHNLSSSVAFR